MSAPSAEGDYYYDLYGNLITRGWLVFNNSQTPAPAVWLFPC